MVKLRHQRRSGRSAFRHNPFITLATLVIVALLFASPVEGAEIYPESEWTVRSRVLQSPSGRYAAWVEGTPPINLCDYGENAGANECPHHRLMLRDRDTGTAHVVGQTTLRPDNWPEDYVEYIEDVQFSPDELFLFFSTGTWKTSRSNHRIELSTLDRAFLPSAPGALKIIRSCPDGLWAGYFVHAYSNLYVGGGRYWIMWLLDRDMNRSGLLGFEHHGPGISAVITEVIVFLRVV